MALIPITITDAGLAEIVNAEQTGTGPVVLKEIAFGTGQYTPDASRKALASEFKRFDTIQGGATADNVVHVSISDESNDAYTVYEVGVFTDKGTLFAVYSQNAAVIQKAAGSQIMLALDIVLTNANPDSVTVGETNFVLNMATTEKQGIIELATANEVIAGSDAFRAVTPAGLKALTGTTARKGLVELATDTEAIAGKSGGVVVTPYGVRLAIEDRIQNVGEQRTRDSSLSDYGLS